MGTTSYASSSMALPSTLPPVHHSHGYYPIHTGTHAHSYGGPSSWYHYASDAQGNTYLVSHARQDTSRLLDPYFASLASAQAQSFTCIRAMEIDMATTGNSSHAHNKSHGALGAGRARATLMLPPVEHQGGERKGTDVSRAHLGNGSAGGVPARYTVPYYF